MSDRRLVITDTARDDLADIRRYTAERYGPAMVENYDKVLKQALNDIQQDPQRMGSKDRADDLHAPGFRSYHVALSRDRSESTVKTPRHVLLYFEPKPDEVVVSRVIHEARDLQRHLPEQHLEQARTFKRRTEQTQSRDKGRER